MKLKRLFTVTAFITLAIVAVVFALFLISLYLDQQRAERAEAEATRNYGPEAETVAEAAVKIAAEAEATAKAARIIASKAPATGVDHHKGESRYGKPHGKGVSEKYPVSSLSAEQQALMDEFMGITVPSMYEGEWSDGKPHGKGVIHWAGGDVYSGEWQNGKLFGMGVIRFANGDTYEGEWKSDEPAGVYRDSRGRTGKGVYRWANGDSWAGKFRRDERYGKGIYRFKGGKAETECFKENSVVDC